MKARKWIALCAAVMMAAGSLSACSNQSSAPATTEAPEAEATTAVSEETTEAAEAAEAETTEAADEGQAVDPFAAAAEAAAKEAEEAAAVAAAADAQATSGSIFISGYEWGPGVNKVILELPDAVKEVSIDGAVANTNTTTRTVTAGYPSDAQGEKAEGESNYVTLELETNYTASGSPFNYDFMVTFQNHWVESYPVIACFSATGEAEKTYGFNGDCIGSRICPEAALFTNRGVFTGTYANPMTGANDELTLQYAAYEPEALTGDGVKNPLVIWLHGQGEGGTDPDIVLLGNEVTALAKEPIQGYFTTEGGNGGAYVLAMQTATYWMDGGDGTNSSGDLTSRYTQILMDAIKSYVDGHEDIDTNRIYLGGCSNGGYMTMNMLVNFPDYWAAAYPNCEAYAFYTFEEIQGDATAMGGSNTYGPSTTRWMTDEKIEAIKDIPIWFAQSADDSIVVPANFAFPTYQALLKAGAKNAWFSLFETVNGTDDPTAQYMGHWVWCYLFNNQITSVQDTEAIAAAEDESFGFVASNAGGGSKSAEVDGVSYDNIFAWMNAQSK